MTTAPVNNPLLAFGMRVGRWRHLLVPGAILTLLAVLVVPLPPAILDVLIAANISLAAVILLTTALALLIPDFGLACNLVGSVANTLVGVIMPALFYRKLMGDSLPARERTACTCIVAFGFTLLTVSTVVTIVAIVGVHNPGMALCQHAPFDAVCGPNVLG